MASYEMLKLNIKILKFVLIWHDDDSTNLIKTISFFSYLIIYFNGFAVIAAAIRQLAINFDDFGAFTEGIIGGCDFLVMVYMKCWLIKHFPTIKKLVLDINNFLEFSPKSVLENAEKDLQKYTKSKHYYIYIIFILYNIYYGVIYNIYYVVCNVSNSNKNM